MALKAAIRSLAGVPIPQLVEAAQYATAPFGDEVAAETRTRTLRRGSSHQWLSRSTTDPRAPDKEVQIGAGIRLHYGLEIETAIAARERFYRRYQAARRRASSLVGNMEMQRAVRDVDLDHVAILDERQGSAFRSFRRGMKDDGAVAVPDMRRIGKCGSCR